MVPIMTNDGISIPIQKLNSAEAGWDRKEEKVQNDIFRKFWPIFRYSLILLLNFTDFFAATNISTYFKCIPIDIFMKTFFSDDI